MRNTLPQISVLGSLVLLLNCSAYAAIDWANPRTYGAPVNLGPVVNSSASEQTPSLTSDELTLIFSSGGPGLTVRPGTQGSGGLWMTTRTSMESPWTTPVRVAALDTADGEIDGSITADGLEIIFAVPTGTWTSTRTNTGAAWAAPVKLPATINASNAYNYHGSISYDGLTLIFHRELFGAGQGDLFMSVRTNRSDPWPSAVTLPSQINTGGNGEAWACLSSDGHCLLFSRYAETNPNTADIYVSTRESLTSPWKTAIRLPSPVNLSSAIDIGPWLSLDSRRLYFCSSRAGGYGSLDLWMITISDLAIVSAGVQTNGFGFTISSASEKVVVIEAATDLAHPKWSAIDTNTLSGGSAYFTDRQWADYPGRFYRLQAQ